MAINEILDDATELVLPLDAKPEGVPDNFWKANDDGKGHVDVGAMAKAWTDTQKYANLAKNEVGELRKMVKPPASIEDYATDFDLDAFKKDVPKLSSADGFDGILANLHKAAFEAKIPVDAVHTFTKQYFGEMEKAAAEAKDKETLYKEAVAGLGKDGNQIAKEITTFLKTRHAAVPFDDEQKAQLDTLLHSTAGIQVLHRLSRGQVVSAPPSIQATATDPQKDKEQVRVAMRDPRYINDAEFRDQVQRRMRSLKMAPTRTQAV